MLINVARYMICMLFFPLAFSPNIFAEDFAEFQIPQDKCGKIAVESLSDAIDQDESLPSDTNRFAMVYCEALEGCRYETKLTGGYAYNGTIYPLSDDFFAYVISILESVFDPDAKYPDKHGNGSFYWSAHNYANTIEIMDIYGNINVIGELEFRDIFAIEYIQYINDLKVDRWHKTNACKTELKEYIENKIGG